MHTFRIGTLASRAALNPPTIRYYEEVGLLRKARRMGSGQRVYDNTDVERLTFIKRCREFGFSIEQVKQLVALTADPSSACMDARTLAAEQLEQVRVQLGELRALEQSLEELVGSFDSRCAGGPGPDCVILGDLARS